MTAKRARIPRGLHGWLWLAFFALIFARGAAACEPALEHALLWQVRSANATVYLYGTIHLGRRDFFPLPGIVEDALQRAQVLGVEFDVTDLSSMQAFMQTASYPPGETLGQHLSAELWREVQDLLPRYKLTTAGVETMRPWMLATLLVMLEAARNNYDAAQGVDMYLIRKAKQSGKQVLALEDAQALGALNALTQAENEAWLRSTLSPIRQETLLPLLDELVEAWCTGDEVRLQRAFNTAQQGYEAALAGTNEVLLHQRNRAFATKIEAMLASDQVHLVAVGAAHLIGNEALPALLAQRGYEVSRVLPLR